MQSIHYASISEAVRITYQSEGIHGFYRGYWSFLTWVVCLRVSSFSIYTKVRDEFKSSLKEYYTRDMTRVWISCLASGAITGGLVATLSAPFELIKVNIKSNI